jgi:hypothetical protein
VAWPKWITENRLLAAIQIVLGIGGAGVVLWLLKELTSWPPLLLASIALLVAALVTWLAIRYVHSPKPQAVEPWPGTYLLGHQLTVLRSELQHLHQLFLQARDADNAADLRWIEVAEYQRGVESRIRNELAIHGTLLTLYWDDTGEPQPAPGDDDRTTLVKFLRRRHARLQEVIVRLEALR